MPPRIGALQSKQCWSNRDRGARTRHAHVVRTTHASGGRASAEEVYAVTAYLLQLNGIIGAQDMLNAQTLPRMQMPNRAHFRVSRSAGEMGGATIGSSWFGRIRDMPGAITGPGQRLTQAFLHAGSQ